MSTHIQKPLEQLLQYTMVPLSHFLTTVSRKRKHKKHSGRFHVRISSKQKLTTSYNPWNPVEIHFGRTQGIPFHFAVASKTSIRARSTLNGEAPEGWQERIRGATPFMKLTKRNLLIQDCIPCNSQRYFLHLSLSRMQALA